MNRSELIEAFSLGAVAGALGVVAGGVIIGSIWPLCWLIAKLGGAL